MTSQTIEVLEDLLGKLQHLLPENQQLLLTFAEFLLERQMRSIPENTSVKVAPPPGQQRVLGLHQGMGWMSEDFNQPLPDAFWLGEA
ncbi:MAG: DUF2281 domain-containing protein [Oscillatoriales cyanobacterium]|nr:MAG: DUF2281 domain-containing protein [Oscillatoriales cyanobacterium]TAF37822.1 MAG: DUF2281 domain-containing protein [Oscillatoriales cyanobacterium]TAF69969.1 MAG: DUF2281 domain-containing protein [Oscillatoriales cyanobacterium]